MKTTMVQGSKIRVSSIARVRVMDFFNSTVRFHTEYSKYQNGSSNNKLVLISKDVPSDKARLVRMLKKWIPAENPWKAAKEMTGRRDMRLGYELRFFPLYSDAEFGQRYLSKMAKEGRGISNDEFGRYALEYDLDLGGVGPNSFKTKDIWFDGLYSFNLTYNGNLAAFLSFVPTKGGIRIIQIQGVKQGKDENKLKNLKWERALIAYACDWARGWEMEKVEILPSEKNRWVMNNYVSLEPMRMIYDVSAKRSGFKKNGEGIWEKILADE